jgi:hypothetical protein
MMIPLPRMLQFGHRGRDVLAVQRGLVAARVRDRAPTARYGHATVRQVQAFQRRERLETDGIYGSITHDALGPVLRRDAYAVWLFEHPRPAARTGREAHARRRIAAAALLGHRNRDAMHYTQGARRMEGVTERIDPPRFPRFADCSSYATWCYWAAGAPDPNGRGYDGLGYTGTQIENGRLVTAPEVGDLVFYGAPVGHVAVFVGDGMVVSHGSEPGPYLLPTAYRTPVQIRDYIDA